MCNEPSKKSWIDISMLVVTTLGFFAACWTISDTAKAFRGSIYSSASPWIFDIDKVFIENPDLRPYFYADYRRAPIYFTRRDLKSPEAEKAYLKTCAMAEYILDTFDSYLSTRTKFGHDTLADEEGWKQWMRDTFRASPVLVRYMEEHMSWYADGELYKQVYKDWRASNLTLVNDAMTKGDVSTGETSARN